MLDQLGLEVREVVFIDDKIENVEGAKAVGIDAILFENDAQVKRELQKRRLEAFFEKGLDLVVQA